MLHIRLAMHDLDMRCRLPFQEILRGPGNAQVHLAGAGGLTEVQALPTSTTTVFGVFKCLRLRVYDKFVLLRERDQTELRADLQAVGSWDLGPLGRPLIDAPATEHPSGSPSKVYESSREPHMTSWRTPDHGLPDTLGRP